MSQPEAWSAKITKHVAAQVRHYRLRRGLSIQALSKEVDELGLKIERPVLSNLENGRRHTLSVAELFVIARALRVPPLLLLFPVGREAEMEVLPRVTTSTGEALRWAETGGITGGEQPFPEDASTIANFRDHAELVSAWSKARHDALRTRELLARPDDELATFGDDRTDLKLELSDYERVEENSATKLRLVRRALRDAGLDLPDLPRALQFVDEAGR